MRPLQLFAATLFVSLAFGQTNVLTQHNDMGRTGQNTTETVLNTTNVNSSTFGQLYSLKVDGAVYTQPLYLSSLNIGGTNHSVVFIETEHDSVYAFDANSGAQLWHVTMTDAAHGAAPGATSDPVSTTGCTDVSIDGAPTEWGISGTPVIDQTAGILYLVSRTFEGTYPVQRLHALDVTTGLEKLGPPTTIAASATSTGSGSSASVVNFDPKWINQRVGLLLLNGSIYIGFGSVCDFGTWHGWILSYNASTLAQTGTFLTTPNGAGSGVWMGGAGLSADIENGVPRIFPVTGNGTFDATSALGTNNVDYGDDVLRLNVANGMTVADMFTPSNQAYLLQTDGDLGSAGTVILPDQPGANPHLLAQMGKQGYLYLLNRDNLGGYNTSTDQVVQKIVFTQAGQFSGLWGSMAYWNNSLYVWARVGALTRYPLSNGLLSSTPSETASPIQGTALAEIEGVTPTISANGTQTSSGIVWAVDPASSPQIAYAFNASNVSQMLWNSTQNSARDGFSSHLKQTVPTVADGKVFIGQSGQVNVYGLLSTVLTPDFSLIPATSSVDVPAGTSLSTAITVSPLNGFSGSLNVSVSGLPTGVTASLTSTSATLVTLTLTAASTAPNTSSPAVVTVTAISGSLSHALTYSVNVNKVQVVSLANSFNVWAIINDGSVPINGGFDAQSYAYSATELGTTLTVGNIPYYFGTPGQADAVSGTTVTLPTGNFATLNLAAAGAGTTNQNFVVTYSDGTTTTFTQSISNWGYPAGYAGETIASTMAYRVTPSAADQNGPWYLYSYSFALNSAKTVQSVTLPSGTGVVVLAMTLAAPTTTTTLTAQTITFNGISTQTAGTSMTLAATASSGMAVSFASSTTSVCTVSNGTATLVAAGTCVITASQAGNSTYAAATPVTQSFTVAAAAAAQTITFNAIATQTVGTPLTLSATASSGLAVSFASSTASICTVSSGTASFIAAGICTITATQAGNASYAAATPVSQTFNVQTTTNAAGYDVVLLVGQSNMVGLGTGTDDVGDAAADPRILQWNPVSSSIVPAFDPLYQNSPFYNIGLGMTFAKAYVKHMAPNRKLLLVGAATGATGFEGGYWLTPSGSGVTTALSWINAAMSAAGSNANLVGILWHQGENDIAYGGASAYEANLQNLISYFRSNITGASSTTPFVVGEVVNPWLTYNLTANPSWVSSQVTVLNDFHTLPDGVPYTAWTSAAELGSDPYYSTIHFSALSQRQLGRRYADKFFEAQNNLPQPQVSQKWWAGTFYDDGRGLGSANTNSIPVNNPATVSGTVSAAIDPVRGNVAQISQGNGYLTYQVPGSTFNASYTKMAWFLPGASSYTNNLISANNSGQTHFLSAANSGSGKIQIAAGHGTASAIVSSQVTNTAGAWMNIAAVYNASAQTMTLYLNGALIATQSGVAAAPSSSATTLPVNMGSNGGSGGLDGELAGSRVWNVALSAAQVSAIYNYESTGTANEPGFGIVVGAPSQASNAPGTANTVAYNVPVFAAAVGGTVASQPVTIVPNNGFTGSPTLALTGLPSGATYTLSPTATANSYTLQLSGLSASTAAGAYPLVLSGTSSTAGAEAAAMLCLSSTDSSGNVHVNLSCFFNQNNYLVSDGTKFSGGLVGAGVAYSANLLGTTVTSGSVQFSLGAPNTTNGLSGATVTLPPGQYANLSLLGTGISNQTSQAFTVTYSDGTTSTFTQSLSDWQSPQGYSGETTAATMSYVDTSAGATSSATVHLYTYSFALNSAKTVTGITLPANSDVIVMAMTLSGATKAATPGFSLSTAATSSLTAGGTATSTITINPSNSFTGSVTLSVSGLPTGVTASFATNPATTTSVLTLTATSAAAASTSTVTITGTSGSLTATTTTSLTVKAAPASCTNSTDSSGNLHVNLACSFNQSNYLVTDGTKFSTGLIGSTVAYSATLLGTTVTSGSVQFTLGAPNGTNGLSAATVSLPAGQYASLSMLGTGIYNQASQTFTVTYSDGTTTSFTQGLSDWQSPQGYTGETTAATMSHVDVSNGTTSSATVHLYSYSFALNSGKTLASITLPSNSDVIAMAMTLIPATKTSSPGYTLSASPASVSLAASGTATNTVSVNPTNSFSGSVSLSVSGLPTGVTASFGTNPATTSSVLTLTASSAAAAGTSLLTITGTSGSLTASTTVSLSVTAAAATTKVVSMSSSFNVNAIFNNGSAVTNGGFDTASYAYSANLLGTGLTALGVPFSFGTVGQPDGAANVTVTLPAGTFGHLDLLGAGAFGNYTGQKFTVTYTDGTTSVFTQSISDWGTPQKYTGETIASTMSYRLTQNGSQQAIPFYVYAYSFALNNAKTVKSVTLPGSRDIVIMAMTLSVN